MIVFIAFALSSGCVKSESMTSTPFVPAILACRFTRSISGPLSIQILMPSEATQACGCPLIFMTLISDTSHPERTSAVPWTNSAFSSMYSSPQLITRAPRPIENATRRMVATSGVIPLRLSNSAIIHLSFI